MLRLAATILLAVLTTANAHADEYRPAFLELIQVTDQDFDVLWKVPARGEFRLSIYVRFPENSEIITPVRSTFIGGAFIERFSLRSENGLVGGEVVIEGLTGLSTDVLVRIERTDGSTEVARLAAANPSFIVQGSLTRLEIATTYTLFGIEHILEGLDHLLFVTCLLLIAGTGRRILITITGFTIAHSITLTLAALDLVHLPTPPIEAVIALSIVFLAREIALQRRDTLTWRYPIAVSASFGLLHGFGFASALSEIGLPRTEIPAALLAFNVGVEIGQILFVSAMIVAVWIVTTGVNYRGAGQIVDAQRVTPLDLLRRAEKPVAYLVGGVAMIWTVQRTMVFFS